MSKCEWYSSSDFQASCNEEAGYTTCDPMDGFVCEKHKCRCSKPIDNNVREKFKNMAQQIGELPTTILTVPPNSDSAYDARLKSRIERLDYFSTLEKGWLNGDGETIDKKLIDLAKTYLNTIDINKLDLPYVYPTGEGGIQFEWDFGNIGCELEFHSEIDIDFRYISVNPNNDYDCKISDNLQLISLLKNIISATNNKNI